jgi:hypothetical protein
MMKEPSAGTDKMAEHSAASAVTEPAQRVLTVGLPDHSHCDNAVTTSKYTWWSFLPVVSLMIHSIGKIKF